MKFGVIETTALASLLLFFGYRARATIPILQRLNIPAPVIGGLTMSLIVLMLGTTANAMAVMRSVVER